MKKEKVTIHDVNSILWQQLKPYLGRTVLLVLMVILSVLSQVAMPWFYKQFFDVLIGDIAPFYGTLVETLVAILIIIFAINFIGNLTWRISGLLTNRLQPYIIQNTERFAYEYLLHHSQQFFSNNFTGGLVRKVRRLSRSFERILDQFQWHFLPILVSIAGVMIVLGQRHILIAIAVIIWVAVFILINIIFSRWKLRYDEKRAEADSEVTATLADGVTNNTNIKLFSGYSFELDLFKKATARYAKLQKWTWDLNEINNTVQGLLFISLEFGAMYYAIHLWQAGILTVGDFVLLQTYLLLIFQKVWDIGRYIRDTYESYADAKEMVAILKTPHEVIDSKTAKPLKVTRGKIEFKDVNFRYAKTRKILDKFNLTIKAKEKVALVGPSGAGKSTIIKSLFRFFDIQKGSILIDGQKIHRVTQESLCDQLSLVPQSSILFHRSLMDNIRYGRQDATDEEVIEAAKKARCHEFISELPQGYDTFVGERGIKLSGGERQRVAIARAILKNAPILVLDEATSSLDSESELLIQEALEELMKDKTTIVIAHRLSTIMKMDRIAVIENGKVVDTGTHEELSKKMGTYKNLWEIQAGGFNT